MNSDRDDYGVDLTTWPSSGAPVDLSNCDREPIHAPGSIQPHGYLLALTEASLIIRQASSNCHAVLGVEAQALIGRCFADLLSESAQQALKTSLQVTRLQTVNPIKLQLARAGEPRAVDAVAHRSQGLLLLELEATATPTDLLFFNVYRQINQAVEELGAAEDLESLYRVTTESVKALSGYQRVMIYQFDPDWNGKVVAEAREPQQEPFLGLHYPASDIPAQARQLYLSNWLRTIPNVDYTPAPMIAGRQVVKSAPLDLSHCSLRSVSPMHIQYLKNMGVGASTSISVIKEGRLWGLIALHHERPAYLAYEVRQGLEFIGRMFSAQLAAKQTSENVERKARLKSIQPQLLARMKQGSAFLDGLIRDASQFMELAEGCGGGAIVYRGRLARIGNVPPEAGLQRLIKWLQQELGQRPMFHTSSLARYLPEAAEFKDTASGLMAISIPELEPGYVMWFKPEVIQTVDWGGDPNKPVEFTGAGAQLSPRRSFALWRETVNLTSLPWAAEEIEAIEQLRRSIIEVDLERQVRAAMESNAELDQFASVVAHDLKEPLRGIGFFAEFLEQDLKAELNSDAQDHLVEIKQLNQKARQLVTELHEYSKIGRIDLAYAQVDLNVLIETVAARLKAYLMEHAVELRIPKPLPIVFCDRVRVTEIFANLIANAVKYNDKPLRWVEIGANCSSSAPTLYVKDNGIGIATQSQARVFKIFQRLHEPQQFGGGTGVGLAIVKRIVDRHGGRVWVESEPGHGSTFYFTLQPETSI